MNDNLILEAAFNAWQRMAPLRQRRSRYCRFTYGDQWSDPASETSGKAATEGQEAIDAGCKPLTNNLIRRLVKTVVGRFRMERAENAGSRGDIDPGNLNHLDELDARTLEEFLISGMAVHRVCRERRMGGPGPWVDIIPPDRFFVNAFTDPRGCDLELAGCLLDMSIAEVIMRFSGNSARRAAQLRKLYAAEVPADSLFVSHSGADTGVSFHHAPEGRCRVIEVWTLESRERLRCHDPLEATFGFIPLGDAPRLRKINAGRRKAGLPKVESRWEFTTVWHCRYLTPGGELLDSFDSPLADGSLPYSIKMYPLVGGEVHSLVEDVIDQQKYVNRLITLMDHIMGVSAKGTLLFPIECLPRDNSRRLSPEEAQRRQLEKFGRLWAAPGAVIPYHPYDGSEPHQVSTPAADIGAMDMLRTQIQLFEDISGVNSALMGKDISGAVGAQRYESEIRNSAISILDLMETFADFTARRDRLLSLA